MDQEGSFPLIIILDAIVLTTLTPTQRHTHLAHLKSLCKTTDTWLHVILSDLSTFPDLDLADSVTLDLASAFQLPEAVSVMLVRDGDTLKRSMSGGQTTQYMKGLGQSEGFYNPTDYTMELSRPCRSLPLWMTIRLRGMCELSIPSTHL